MEIEPYPQLLLIRRKNPPFKDMWALPGGFIQMEETLEESALRELEEETGINNIELEEFGTFGNPDRDPRGRVITVAYVGIVDSKLKEPSAGSDASEVEWFSISDLPKLAFDHELIIHRALERLI